MVRNAVEQELNLTFAALSDPTRRAILNKLALREANVSELARPFRTSLPAISKHLRVLEGAGLVKREKRGRVHLLRLRIDPLREAGRWIDRYERFWKQQLDSLESYLAQAKRRER